MLRNSNDEGKEYNLNKLHFENLHKDILLRKKIENEKSIFFDSQRNIIDHKQIVTTATIQSDLSEKNAIKGNTNMIK